MLADTRCSLPQFGDGLRLLVHFFPACGAMPSMARRVRGYTPEMEWMGPVVRAPNGHSACAVPRSAPARRCSADAH